MDDSDDDDSDDDDDDGDDDGDDDTGEHDGRGSAGVFSPIASLVQRAWVAWLQGVTGHGVTQNRARIAASWRVVGEGRALPTSTPLLFLCPATARERGDAAGSGTNTDADGAVASTRRPLALQARAHAELMRARGATLVRVHEARSSDKLSTTAREHVREEVLRCFFADAAEFSSSFARAKAAMAVDE